MCCCVIVPLYIFLVKELLLGDLTIILFGDEFIEGNLTLLIRKIIVILMCRWPLCHPAIDICCTERAKGRCTLLYRTLQWPSYIVVQDVPMYVSHCCTGCAVPSCCCTLLCWHANGKCSIGPSYCTDVKVETAPSNVVRYTFLSCCADVLVCRQTSCPNHAVMPECCTPTCLIVPY